MFFANAKYLKGMHPKKEGELGVFAAEASEKMVEGE